MVLVHVIKSANKKIEPEIIGNRCCVSLPLLVDYRIMTQPRVDNDSSVSFVYVRVQVVLSVANWKPSQQRHDGGESASSSQICAQERAIQGAGSTG